MQEEPQHSINMWNSKLEGQGAGSLERTSAVGEDKGFSMDNQQGAGGTPSTGGGTAEGDCRAPPAAQSRTIGGCYFGEP